VIIGFVLFLLCGFVFGYSAPKAWAFLPLILPITVGLYTGFMDVFDTQLIILIVVGVAVTILGVVLGRALLYSIEGNQRTA
jgi:hypothetical protein